MTRIAKVSRGALTPPQRPVDEDCASWNRYDVAGHRTAYAAIPPEAAYAEALANLRVSCGLLESALSDLFDVPDSDPSDLMDVVWDEWDSMFGGFTPGKVAAAWREERREYKLTLPATGWLVDIEAAESMSALTNGLGPHLRSLGVDPALTTGHLHGDDRAITTAVAAWVRNQTLDDGDLPHGIQFASKHGGDWTCAAIWLRRTDDGLDNELTTACDGVKVEAPDQNPPLKKIEKLFNLRVY